MTLRLELFVTDLRASVDFYTRVLGFAIERESDDYMAVRNGHVLLGLGPAAGLSPAHYFRPEVTHARKGVGVEIVLEVDDVQAALQRVIDQGARVHTPLKQRPWGLTDFRIVDPDGYFLRITSRG
jgi:predicted enzyme related to lactoylglutathione lyase